MERDANRTERPRFRSLPLRQAWPESSHFPATVSGAAFRWRAELLPGATGSNAGDGRRAPFQSELAGACIVVHLRRLVARTDLAAYRLCGCRVTGIFLPVGLLMLNRLPAVLTLRSSRKQTTGAIYGNGLTIVRTGKPQQVDFLLRAVYFLFVGWWLGYILCFTIVLMSAPY
jgi:hypothetical protein